MGGRMLLAAGVFALAVCSLIPAPIRAEWLECGVPVTLVGWQYSPEIIPDYDGGAIIVWHDSRYPDLNIYAERINKYGHHLWTMTDNIPICTEEGDQEWPKIVPDGAGGAIIVWSDERAGWADLYANRIDANGEKLWTTGDGILLYDHTTDISPFFSYSVVPDGFGGAIIAWREQRYNNFYSAYVTRVDANGTLLWNPPRLLGRPDYESDKPELIADGSGGAFVAWEDTRGAGYYTPIDIYAQKFDSSGNEVWTTYGVPVIQDTLYNGNPLIASDGAGSIIVVWGDRRNWQTSGDDVFAQGLNASGGRRWDPAGKPVFATLTDDSGTFVVSDGAGGAIIVGHRDTGYPDYEYDIYAERISSYGAPQWGSNFDGVPVCTASDDQGVQDVFADGEGGVMIMWEDYAGGSFSHQACAQRLSSAGSPIYQINGIPLCEDGGMNQCNPHMTLDQYGGAIVAWEDAYLTRHIYAQKIDSAGTVPPQPELHIISVEDVPGDNGGWVRVETHASDNDNPYVVVHPVIGYNVWRRMDAPSALTESTEEQGVAAPATAEIFKNLDVSPGLRLSKAAALGLGFPPGEWESLGFHVAAQRESYHFTVPTYQDSVPGDPNYAVYCVSAHTTDWTYYFVSAPDSGYSMDNIAPCAPAVARGVYNDEGLRITWHPNRERDLKEYRIYKSFCAYPIVKILKSTTCDTAYVDTAYDPDYCAFYRIQAIDDHGNGSEYGYLYDEDITGVEEGVPDVTFIDQNYPNPFNPKTHIAFGIDEEAFVALVVYDSSGRLVRTLVNERRAAGRYTEEWNGLDDAGKAAASGVYFCRLTAGLFTETKKMVLLR